MGGSPDGSLNTVDNSVFSVADAGAEESAAGRASSPSRPRGRRVRFANENAGRSGRAARRDDVDRDDSDAHDGGNDVDDVDFGGSRLRAGDTDRCDVNDI